jgi:squalene synthase HpnC
MPPLVELEIARTAPPPGCSVAEAQRYTRWLATHHYENFNVVSWLLPRRLHQHFYNLYAYCRWADDLGDEVADPARALELLDWWERELHLCYAGQPAHPVFVALQPTIRACDIPIKPFADLLIAFRQDQSVRRYATWDDMIGYCLYSANPVGRLVLYLCGYCDAERQRLSDFTCTALQLANFWQDVARDQDERGRIYIPLDRLGAHGLSFADIEAKRFDACYVALMKELIADTRALFAQGLPLAQTVDSMLRLDIELFSRGGLEVLNSIERIGYDTLHHRPAISRSTQIRMLCRALGSKIAAFGKSYPAEPTQYEPHPSTVLEEIPEGERNKGLVSSAEAQRLRASYEECDRIARAARSSFYMSFFGMRREKRLAMCALYAFMRLVDDVSDEKGDAEAKQKGLARWRGLLDSALAGDFSGHKILPALADTVGRFQIPPRYLHDLISGAEMDLTVRAYPTFDRLAEYCYRVAGTVGLCCLQVFGYRDPKAPDLAEKLGIAFQLTNIVRDVRSDHEIGRIYLPEEDLQRFHCQPEELARGENPAARELLAFEADRAWRFYEEGAPLVRLVSPDSRAALWALIRTYSTLLSRIEAKEFDVFSSRISLSNAEKVHILLIAGMRGWWKKDVIAKRVGDRRRAGGPVLRRRAG